MKKEMSPQMNDVERQLLDALLRGDDPILLALRNQLQESQIESRELSGVGFFLNFSVPASGLKIASGRIVIGDVYFDLEGIEHGGGAILFVDDGHISMLEAYLNGDEQWPKEPHLTRIYYDSDPRDMEALRKSWAPQQTATPDRR
jgi:hypothetical protein